MAYATVSMPIPQAGFLLTAVRLRLTNASYEKRIGELGAVEEFVELAGIWLGTVRNWLVGWDGDIRDSVFSAPPPRVRLVLVAEPERGPFNGGGGPSQALRPQQVALDSRVRAAFAAASADLALPLSHGLLYEARLAHARHDHRQSVINSCTAAEVGLSKHIRGHFANRGFKADEVKEMTKVNGVVELYRIAAATTNVLSVSIGRVKGQLAGPRNLAAHEGELLDHGRAAQAFQTARSLLDDFDPMPTPEQVVARVESGD